MKVETIPVDDDLVILIHETLDTNKFNTISKVISKNLSLHKDTIDSEQKDELFDLFTKPILDTIQSVLTDIYKCNFYTSGYRINKNRKVFEDWHLHKPEFYGEEEIVQQGKSFVAVTYLHALWDSKYGGDLLIGKTTKDKYKVRIKSVPNSTVIHSRNSYHGVDWVNLDIERMGLYSHWTPLP